MNKAELVKAVAERAGSTQADAAKHVAAMMEIIRDTVVEGDFVNVSGLGVFRSQARKSRLGYNPKTGEKIEIPARRVPAFTPSKSFKESVAQ